MVSLLPKVAGTSGRRDTGARRGDAVPAPTLPLVCAQVQLDPMHADAAMLILHERAEALRHGAYGAN